MESTPDPSSKLTRHDEPELDLYTIPIHSSWFSWDEIHEKEKISLKEFFDGSSISRTPKIYKEYRDFIISKYREDPSRRLTFAEIRKSLVGFGGGGGGCREAQSEVEDGAPNGIRVVAMPNSLKPITMPLTLDVNGEVDENGFRLPPLASYSDVFSDLTKEKGLVCGNCGDNCDSGHYNCLKGSPVICVKCFKNGNYGENRSVDDFKFNDCNENRGNRGAVWTEAETLLLLESVLKHGDDWELVVQNVQTKTKLDCISKLIELPFGELMLGSSLGKSRASNDNTSSIKPVQTSLESQENIKNGGQGDEQINESEQNGDAENQGPPLKRKCITSLSDAGISLMKQVAVISTMVGPHISAAAADAAVAALCDENPCVKDIFDGAEDNVTEELGSPIRNNELERSLMVEDSEINERPILSEIQKTSSEKNAIPLPLQMRAAIATALGAAAANAKSLADQEHREIEHLVATIIETQMKKLHCKIQHFEDLELIMEKEYTHLKELKESIIAERIDILQRVFNAGISRWRDPISVKSHTGSVS
ncbi:SWI/SNF complex subunit SWI3A [Vitis vinifera]|uniref:SWI/SNF complex subunit SWI3A n=1 Tax=Vitis vinifera TaxID=29760 RepID=A0A438EXT1_VITVI|nr:SWI/SNF complex subunit SWI3A [Vitis vinifera]